MPLFRSGTVVLQPILYMFTKCMLCMEESIGIMEKWIEPMANSMKTMEKSMSAVWVNQSAPWKTWWTVQMANFRSQIQQSRAFCSKMQQIARKSAPDWKTQKKQKEQEQIKKNLHPFEMCFAPQRRALFQHLNFQKCSDVGVFCTFWLGNVLRATTACTFSTSQL